MVLVYFGTLYSLTMATLSAIQQLLGKYDLWRQ
jgi:hypothetical protein